MLVLLLYRYLFLNNSIYSFVNLIKSNIIQKVFSHLIIPDRNHIVFKHIFDIISSPENKLFIKLIPNNLDLDIIGVKTDSLYIIIGAKVILYIFYQ
jgi:hypothetical protein